MMEKIKSKVLENDIPANMNNKKIKIIFKNQKSNNFKLDRYGDLILINGIVHNHECNNKRINM